MKTIKIQILAKDLIFIAGTEHKFPIGIFELYPDEFYSVDYFKYYCLHHFPNSKLMQKITDKENFELKLYKCNVEADELRRELIKFVQLIAIIRLFCY